MQCMYRSKWRWKGAGVGEEELTKNYIQVIVVVASEMGLGIILITVRESGGIAFVRLSVNPVIGRLDSIVLHA